MDALSDQMNHLVNLECSAEKVDIRFEKISYSRRRHLFSKENVHILKEISGEFRSGELTAIIGASGCGKSTLLDILTGFTTVGVSGEICDNGEIRKEFEFRKRCGYIMQDDKLQPLLTVQEAMFFAANLQLDSKVSLEKKYSRIEDILESLDLTETKSTRTGNLSGGERKRLSIALELITNPPVLIFDEPTSGLDNTSTKNVISLLSKLSHEGRTIICSIHQPSAMILELFDHLYVINEGKCVYQGALDKLVGYLEDCEPSLKCPSYYNPADYLLDVCQGAYGNHGDRLVEKCENGSKMNWRKILPEGDQIKTGGLLNRGLMDSRNDLYATGCLNQLVQLLKRSIIVHSRDRQLTYTRVALHIITSIFAGLLFFGIGTEAEHILDNFNCLFFSLLFNMFVAFLPMLVAFADDVPIVTKEHFNNWYSIKSYYLAVTAADLPIQFLASFIYVSILFFMTAQPLEWFRFWLFLAMCYLVALVAQSFAMLVSASMKLAHGVIVGPVFIMPFVLSCGFFIHMKDAHPSLQWMFYSSYMRYAIEGAVQALLGFERGKLKCSAEYCHFVYPKSFMEQIGVAEPRLGVDFGVLLGHYVLVKTVTYLFLRNKISGKR